MTDRETGDQPVASELALRRLGSAPPRPAEAPVYRAERLHCAADLLHAHRRFLERTRRAFRQDERVARAVCRLRHLHRYAVLDLLPWRLVEFLPDDLQVAARGADEMPVAVLAHLGEGVLRGHAPVHEPEVADPAVFRLQLPDERHLRLLVARVAGHHFVGERESVRRQDERNHDLEAVAPLVAAVAVALEIAVERLRAVHLEVGARQVEEDDVARRAEEARPAVAQEEEQVVLERQRRVPFAARRNMPVLSHIRHAFPRGLVFTTRLFVAIGA